MSGLIIPGAVKSVQHISLAIGSAAYAGTVAIGAVNPAKTIIVERGVRPQTGETKLIEARGGRWVLLSSTLVEYGRGVNVFCDLTVDYFASVIEFY